MRLREILTFDEIRLAAAYFFDDARQEDLADDAGVLQPALNKRLTRISQKLVAAGVPAPKKFKLAETRKVRQLNNDLYSSL